MKIRKKTWLIAVVAVIVLGLPTAYFGAKYVLVQRVERWKKQGLAAASAGENAKAAELLVRYLQRHQDEIDTLAVYIKVREAAEMPNGQHLTETLAALKLLLAQEPDRLDDRLHLLRLYSRLEQRPEALEAAGMLRKQVDALLAKTASDAHLLQVKKETLTIETDVLMRMGRDREGLAVVDELLKISPDDLQTQIRRITMRKRLGQSANVVIADAVAESAKHPDNPRYQLLEGIAHEKRDYTDQTDQNGASDLDASKLLLRLAQEPKLSEELAAALVAEFDYLGLTDASIKLLERLVKNGGSVEIRNALGRRYWELGRWQEATDALSHINPQDTNSDLTMVALKAISLANAGHKDQADGCRSALMTRDRAAARAWSLILERVVDAGKPDDKKICAEARSSLATDQANPYLDFYYGDSCARLGEIDFAIGAWRRVVAHNVNWLAPNLHLVEALIQRGQTDEALALALHNVERDQNNNLAAAGTINTNAGTAIELARAWAAGVERGSAANENDLLSLVTKLQTRLPGEQQTFAIRVQLLARRGKKEDKEQAAAIVRASLNKTPPPSQQLLLTLANVSQRYALGVHDECYAKCEKLYGLTPELAYARASDRFMTGDAKAGLKEFDELAKRAGRANDVAWQLARTRYLDVTGDASAPAAWVALAEANPANLLVQQAAVGGRTVRGDWDFQLKTIDRLQKLSEAQNYKGLEWRLARARLYVDYPRKNNDDDIQQGAKFCRELIRECGYTLSEPYVLLARVLVRMKLIDGAIEQLITAQKIERFTSVPITMQLATLYMSRGDFDKATQEVDRAAPQLHNAADRRQAAILYAAQGKTDKAVALLEGMDATSGGEADVVLAALYKQRGQNDKAEPIVRKLLEKPSISNVQFASNFYASQGRREDAEKALAKLEGLTLDPGVRELIRGTCYGQLGDVPAATKEFEQATQKAATNASAWSYLAICRLSQGDFKQFESTLQAAGTAGAKDGGEPADQPTRMSIIAGNASLLRESAEADEGRLVPVVISVVRERNTGVGLELLKLAADFRRSLDREQYAARLQQLVETFPAVLSPRMELINCYAAMNRPNDALAAARQALTVLTREYEPARLGFAIASSARQWTAAKEMADAWKRRAPEMAVIADVALAQSALALKDYAGAMSRLQPYLAAAKENPQQYADLITAYCVIAGTNGDTTFMNETIWPLAQQQSEWQRRWVQMAVEIKDAPQAVAALEKLEAILPPTDEAQRTAVAQAYEQIGSRGDDKDAKLLDRSAKLFQELAQRPDVHAVTLVIAGSQAERREDFTGAEDFYRHALKLDPNMWVAQNNLAVLIARRGGDLKEAMELATAASKLQAKQASVFDTLADVQAKSGDFKAAGDSVRQAIRLSPDDPKWRIRLAKYLAQGGDKAEAAKSIGLVRERRLDTALTPEVKKELEDVRKQIGISG